MSWNFETAAVIGTGMMGPGIALTLALGGLKATILSRTRENAEQGLAKAHAQLALVRDNELAPADRCATAEGLIHYSAEFYETIAGADLVIESALEDMKFKQDLFARMDGLAKPGAALTSNTSGLSITAIQNACAHPERFITTHFWNPPHLMPLVEIVRGEHTDPTLATALKELLERCGKTAIVVKKDTPGQLGNRMQMALVREAINIVQEGIADVEDVDLCAKTGFGLRLPVYGILEHQDMVGLDMAKGIVDYVATDLNNEPRAPQIMHDLVAQGKLGVKTGSGFYDWSQKDPAAVRARRDAFVLDFLKRWRKN
ncbi:MAG: 3-hydroxyacyl-CoA dehydrogenase family protein [Candidatus Hydrogenedentes bacterium]|nr:3-hydroxyacyl-CoA dehydrogenase family protein [Candidatus Hydrogenedentota bacterium]